MERMKGNGKRIAAGCLAGCVLALVSPWLLLTQLFASLPMLLLPAVGIAAIYRRAGRAAGVISGMLLMLSFAYFMGPAAMWAAYLLILNPLFMLLRLGDRPFFSQLRSSVMGFGLGLLMAVLMFYIYYGGGFVEQLMGVVPEMVRAMPEEAMEAALATMPGLPTDVAGFTAMVDDIFARLSSDMQLLLPGRLFSGALLTAVFATLISARMLKKAGLAKPGCYVPMSRWYMPPSATGGMLMLLAVGYALYLMEFRGGETVFYTVYDIAVWAFIIQALASISRHLDGHTPGHGVKVLVLCLALAIAFFGGAPYIALYGFASAAVGSRGALRILAENSKNKADKKNNGSGND